jgi:hypothetical protein
MDYQRDTSYGLNKSNIEAYHSGINRLRRYVYMWPPPDQMDTIGSKLHLIHNLDLIATVMDVLRPTTRVLPVGSEIHPDIVIKRTHSDASEHVLMPRNPNRNWPYLMSKHEVPHSIWFGQTMVPTLRSMGEWRVIFIGGEIICTFHTRYNEAKQTWKGEIVDEFYSLAELR